MGQAAGGDVHIDNDKYIKKINDSWAAHDILQKEEIEELRARIASGDLAQKELLNKAYDKISELNKTVRLKDEAISEGYEQINKLKDHYRDLSGKFYTSRNYYDTLLKQTIPYLQSYNILSETESNRIDALLTEIDEVLND